MSAQQISLIKKILLGYWLSVAVVAFLFIDSSFGQKYLLFALLILVAHVLETFVFHNTLQEHSNKVFKDKCLMIPFGFLIPAELKAKAARIGKPDQQ